MAGEDVRQLTRQINRLVKAYAPLMEAQAQVAEAQEEVNDSVDKAKSVFTRFANSLNNPQGKMRTLLKLGYAFILILFRLNNGVEIV